MMWFCILCMCNYVHLAIPLCEKCYVEKTKILTWRYLTYSLCECRIPPIVKLRPQSFIFVYKPQIVCIERRIRNFHREMNNQSFFSIANILLILRVQICTWIERLIGAMNDVLLHARCLPSCALWNQRGTSATNHHSHNRRHGLSPLRHTWEDVWGWAAHTHRLTVITHHTLPALLVIRSQNFIFSLCVCPCPESAFLCLNALLISPHSPAWSQPVWWALQCSCVCTDGGPAERGRELADY